MRPRRGRVRARATRSTSCAGSARPRRSRLLDYDHDRRLGRASLRSARLSLVEQTSRCGAVPARGAKPVDDGVTGTRTVPRAGATPTAPITPYGPTGGRSALRGGTSDARAGAPGRRSGSFSVALKLRRPARRCRRYAPRPTRHGRHQRTHSHVTETGRRAGAPFHVRRSRPRAESADPHPADDDRDAAPSATNSPIRRLTFAEPASSSGRSAIR